MRCEKFLEYLDGCLDGSLKELEMEAMREHMGKCPACKKIYDEQKELLDALNHLDDDVHAPEGLLSDTMERIRKERNPARGKMVLLAGGIAAALCLTLGLGALMGGGLGSSKQYNDTASAASATQGMYAGGGETAADFAAAPETPKEAPMPMPEAAAADYDSGANTANVLNEEGGARQRSALAPEQYGLKIIRTASMDMQSENYDADMQSLRTLVESCGGFITSNEESGNPAGAYEYGTRYSYLTLRVPSDRLDHFIEQAKAIGIVTNSSISQEDVTDQYTDTDRRLQAYQKQYDRVLAMMDQAATVEELIKIESELSRLEILIEDSQGSLNYWDAMVNYSTVNINVSEVRRAISADPTLSERMTNALANSWDNFKDGCKDLLVNTYGSIPYIVLWVVLLGIGAVIVIVVVRRRLKKKK